MKPFADTLARVRAVLFDAGNTLLYLDYPFLASLPACREAAVDEWALRRAEVAARAEASRSYAAGVSEEAMREAYFKAMLRQAGIAAARLSDTVRAVLRRNAERHLWSLVLPGTGEALQEIKGRGFVTGVISNSDGDIERDLREAGLRDFFAFVIVSEAVGIRKPDPRIFQLAAGRAGVPASAAAYVGDIPGVDVEGAGRAGLVQVLIDPLDAFSDVPCLRIRDVSELPALLPPRQPTA